MLVMIEIGVVEKSAIGMTCITAGWALDVQ
jgi:hypothetical protein